MRSLLDFFFGRKPEPEQPAPPVLRNKPQGMAWVRGLPNVLPGASQLNGSAVKTSRLLSSGKWEIEPHLAFLATADFIWNNADYQTGEAVWIRAIADECLEPWKDTGLSQEDVDALYAPSEGRRLTLTVYTADNLPRQGQQ
jgi:hypothetical protein